MSSQSDNNPDVDVNEVMELLFSVSNALAEQAGKAVFAVGGQIPLAGLTDSGSNSHSHVSIRWDTGTGNQCLKASLPVGEEDVASQHAFTQLLSACEPATFGRGNEDVLDESYRKAGKLDAERFSTDFNPYEYGVVDAISRSLAQRDHYGIRAELYKLNVYSGPSGMFKAHVDTPRATAQMGSLVVCLPYAHKGGQLAVRHGGREVVFDWAAAQNAKPATIQWAAFFSDCEHEVLEVTEGHRLTLAYNLFWVSDGPTSKTDNLNILEPESLHFFGALQKLLACPSFLPNGGVVGFTCTHAYPHSAEASSAESLENSLKGLDMVVYQALKRLTGSVRVTGIIDDRKDYYYRNEEEDSRITPVPEDSYTIGKFAVGTTVGGPVLIPGSGEDNFVEPTDPDLVWDFQKQESKETPLYRRQNVAWLNHIPTKDTPKELALAFITYGNQYDLDYYYSSAVIIADFRPEGVRDVSQ
ncbi:hypothetical protein B0H66DRAFT_532 [Apodospora peruviana]|uniref:Fe2OG dioxygenase domain-containing protein n=1 Tax=Apodospora peruviana TaxID=516989 RepID=A0AAE0MF38_9PEZI|nr:hypothetical protein B0H66DRAFT_532 [Apodospora peruviana]